MQLMPITVAQTCQEGLQDLEGLGEVWDEIWSDPDAENAAICLRLLIAHLQTYSGRIWSAMVLEQLDEDARHLPLCDPFPSPIADESATGS